MEVAEREVAGVDQISLKEYPLERIYSITLFSN
jgi:hypothetical protein